MGPERSLAPPMTVRLFALAIDANDPLALARFWAGMLGWEASESHGGATALRPTDAASLPLEFHPTDRPKTVKNPTHFHLTSTSPEDQQRIVDLALQLGGRHIDVGQLPEEPHVVLADPEGNEFCVIEPGNDFLAGCGFLGELTCEGTRKVGYFWSTVLDWPLVWDRDQETAIQFPGGGTKVSWGGEPARADAERPNAERPRMRFELVPDPSSDQLAEVDRLVSLGARVLDRGQDGLAVDGAVGLVDPDGIEFTVLTAR